MVISMTGYGQAALTAAGIQIQIELKSVNHRYTEVAVRMPREWARFEDTLKQTVLRHVRRGRVDVFVNFEKIKESAHAVQIDWELAAAYKLAAEQLKERLSLQGDITLKELLDIPGVVTLQQSSTDGENEIAEAISSCAVSAVRELVAMREREGSFLQRELEQRVGTMEHYCGLAAVLAPQTVKEYAEKLNARIRDLVHQGPIDENRLAMEVAVFADRVNIDEEMNRLQSHFAQFRSLLQSEEPVGRKLDFLVQEMNREVNTIGSKANNASLTAIVVDMKAELEKMREQIQNIE
ncbi:hypothetical protein PAESOLCIP111_00647 [Paenibacillus solanacearum]|uniref:YicC family protein n=1 Tax=Paenibacillus solanacearum TaxID=2048548 RepID=A0A916NG08_9BACL|nr:YicC/YloC family endoribonuclease [Paenibacillus solanacearum]CAG7603938.1 hypothetical protein PAESOLCIP111_00647 [Paenibacillus solanacearum]